MKSCKTVWPALEPSGLLRSCLAGFETVGPSFTLVPNIYTCGQIHVHVRKTVFLYIYVKACPGAKVRIVTRNCAKLQRYGFSRNNVG